MQINRLFEIVYILLNKKTVTAKELAWKMNLDRSFTGDFEEYLNNDWDNADIDIYIALK